jgi:hypothetical protein
MGLISDNNYLKSIPTTEAADIFSNANIQPNKPILEWKPKPTFKTTKERDKFMDIERERWVNGYKGIPGSLYFKTMECQLKNRISGELEPMICRDVDLYHHVRKNISRKNKRSHGTLKGRGIGLSTDFAAEVMYTIILKPGANVNVTSKTQPAISTLFGEKIMSTYETMDEFLRPVKKNFNKTKQTSYLVTEAKYYDINGILRTGESVINALETSNSDIAASAFSGSGAALGIYDELPLHKRRQMLLDSSIYCYINQRTGEMEGFLLWGGTVEETISNDELIAFRETVESAETWKSDITFLDALWGKQDPRLPYNGWTNWKWAEEQYSKELEEKIKQGNPVSLRSFKKNNPRTLDDIFELGSGAYWEDDVTEIVKANYKEVENNKGKEKIETGKIFIMNRKAHFEPAHKGFVEIIERPKEGVKYFMGVDGVGSDERTSTTKKEERSMMAWTILKMYEGPESANFYPVLQGAEYVDTIESSYNRVLACALWYGAKTHIEANQGQSMGLVTHFINAGFEDLLLELQKVPGAPKLKKKVYGQQRNDEVLRKQIEICNMYLRKYGHLVKIPTLASEIFTAKKGKNADRLSSFMTAVIAAWPIISKPAEKHISQTMAHIEQVRWVERDGVYFAETYNPNYNPHAEENGLITVPEVNLESLFLHR